MASPAAASITKDDPALGEFLLARLAESENDDVAAARSYEASLKADPNNSFVAAKAYRSAIDTGNFDLALKSVRLLERNLRLNAEMPLFAFGDAFASRDWRGARDATAKLRELKNFGFLEPLLNLWLADIQGEDAEVWLEQAREEKVARFYAGEQEILWHLVNGNDEAAFLGLTPIIAQNDPRMGPLRVIAARHFIARGKMDVATSLVAQKRTVPEQRLADAIASGDARNLGQRVDHNLAVAFLLDRLAADLSAQQAVFLAKAMVLNALHIAPRDDFVRLSFAQAYSQQKALDVGMAELGRIGRASPYSIAAISLRANQLSDAKKYSEAIAFLSQAVADEPDRPELYLLLGQVQQEAGLPKDAAETFQRGLSWAETSEMSEGSIANFLLLLGSVQVDAGDWDAARKSLERANELAPDSPTILNYLGYSQLERRENVEAALAQVRRAHDLRSNSAAITDSLGWGLHLVGKTDEALSYLEKARDGQPEDPTINEHLGDVYWELGRRYEARYAWQAARLFADDDNVERLDAKLDVGLRPDLVAP